MAVVITNAPTKTGEKFSYRCVQCESYLQPGSESFFCAVCAATYPSIAEVKVFVSDPDEVLSAHAAWIAKRRKDLEDNQRQLPARSIPGSQPDQVLATLERAHAGLLANLAVIETEMTPVKQYLTGRRNRKSFFGDFAGMGWPAGEMLQYYYRDWHGTAEASFLNKLFSDSIKRYCNDPTGAAAVLGSGAGGLLHHLAQFFPRTFGVELAIDTLLLSRKLLDGGEVVLNFNLPSDEFPKAHKSVRLHGAESKRAGIELIAANASQLPFPSSSLSCVTTQYLFDLVPNQRAFAGELRRVLKPGGIWISFGIPIPHLDLPQFLKQAGVDALEISTHQHRHLDLSGLSEHAPVTAQMPVLFVARKNGSHIDTRPNHFAKYFAGKGDSIWSQVPRLAVGVVINHERRFAGGSTSERRAIVIEHASRPVTYTVANETAMLAEWVLRKLDGKRSLREIVRILRAEFGETVKEAEAVKFFRLLAEASIIQIE
jgi:SAM-dependent methyltransferase